MTIGTAISRVDTVSPRSRREYGAGRLPIEPARISISRTYQALSSSDPDSPLKREGNP